MGDQASLSSFHRDLGIPINFQEEAGLINFRSIELRGPLEVSRDVRPPVQMRPSTTAFSRVSTGDSDMPSFVRWKTSLNVSHSREFWKSFESRLLAVHSTWDRKPRDLLTYLLLRENSSWVAYEKLAHLSSQRQGIGSHLEMIWVAWSFSRVAVLKLIFI